MARTGAVPLLWIPNPTFGGLNDYITVNEVARQGGPAAIGNVLRTSSG